MLIRLVPSKHRSRGSFSFCISTEEYPVLRRFKERLQRIIEFDYNAQEKKDNDNNYSFVIELSRIIGKLDLSRKTRVQSAAISQRWSVKLIQP